MKKYIKPATKCYIVHISNVLQSSIVVSDTAADPTVSVDSKINNIWSYMNDDED